MCGFITLTRTRRILCCVMFWPNDRMGRAAAGGAEVYRTRSTLLQALHHTGPSFSHDGTNYDRTILFATFHFFNTIQSCTYIGVFFRTN